MSFALGVGECHYLFEDTVCPVKCFDATLFQPGMCKLKASKPGILLNCFCLQSLCTYNCVCVCPHPRLLITSSVMWCNMDPI